MVKLRSTSLTLRVLRGKCDVPMGLVVYAFYASELDTSTQAIFLPLNQIARVRQRDQKIHPCTLEGTLLVDCLQSAFSLRAVKFLDNSERVRAKTLLANKGTGSYFFGWFYVF